MRKPHYVNNVTEEKFKYYFALQGFNQELQNNIFNEFNKFINIYKHTDKYKKQMTNSLTKEQQDFLYKKGFTKISDQAFCNDDLITISIQDNVYISRIIILDNCNHVSSATEIKSIQNQSLEDFTQEVINSLYL